MNPFNRQDFERLSKIHEPQCLSIYIPTHRGAEGGEGIETDKLQLKNQLKEAEKQLSIFELKDSEIKKYLKPLRNLLNQEKLWKHLSDSLIIFYDGDKLEHHTLPLKMEATTYVNEHYYLKPIAEWIDRNQPYYILSLSLDAVNLYEADQTSLYKVKVSDLIPKSMKDVVGYDYEEKHLQRRSEQGESGDADGIYHGQGMSNDNVKKEEASKFFQQIDKGLKSVLHPEQMLVLSGVEYLVSMYREICSHQNIHESAIHSSPSEISLDELHDQTAKLIDQKMNERQNSIIASFEGFVSESKADSSLDKIIPAAIAGRVDTLFILKNKEVWGKYNKRTHQIDIDEVRKVSDSELLNMAAVKVINQDGKVILMDSEEDLPAKKGSANAIFRYSRAS